MSQAQPNNNATAPNTNSDRGGGRSNSDNESNMSGRGMAGAASKISKKIVVKPSNRWRSKKISFEVDQNPNLQRHFDKIAPEKRLRNTIQLR